MHYRVVMEERLFMQILNLGKEPLVEGEDTDCVDCHETVDIEPGMEKYGSSFPDELLCHECEKKRLEERVRALEKENIEFKKKLREQQMYYCERHSHEQTVPCPDCVEEKS